MTKIKRLMAIALLTLVASLGTPQAFASDGISETPGVTVVVTADSSGISETPGIVSILIDILASMVF